MRKKNKEARYPGTDWKAFITIIVIIGWVIAMSILIYQVIQEHERFNR